MADQLTPDKEAEIVEMTLAGMSWCEINEHWVDGHINNGSCFECFIKEHDVFHDQIFSDIRRMRDDSRE